MTQEEKAKAYDEAIEKFDVILNLNTVKESGTIFTDDVRKIFHELKESEDEKTRKEILDYIIKGSESLYDVQQYGKEKFEKWIAWLEKQAEHANFRNKIQIGDKVTRNEDGVLVNLSQLKRIAKPAEEYNITGIGSKNAQGKLGEMIKRKLEMEKQGEQKPEVDQHSLPVSDDSSLPTFDEDVFHPCAEKEPTWSGDELKVLNEIIEDYEKANKSFSGYQARINWLNSLKYRVQPQPKQEWSEEDEYHKRQILRILKDNGCSQTLQERTEKWIEERLKSLRPQSQWKPSKEQMEALKQAKTDACGKPYFNALASLYVNLKGYR